MSNIERAAAIIEGYYPPCEKCRGNPHLEVGQCQDCADSVVHIAADLASQGLLAPDLPAPNYNEDGKRIWLEGTFSIASGGDLSLPGTVAIRGSEPGGVLYTDPADARALARALLSAADHADRRG